MPFHFSCNPSKAQGRGGMSLSALYSMDVESRKPTGRLSSPMILMATTGEAEAKLIFTHIITHHKTNQIYRL